VEHTPPDVPRAGTEPAAIRFRGHITTDEVRDIYKLLRPVWKRVIRGFAWSLICLVLLDGIGLTIMGVIEDDYAVGGAGAAIAIAAGLLIAVLVRRQRRAIQTLRRLESEQTGPFRPIEGAVSDSGLNYDNGLCHLDYQWPAFTGYRAKNRVVVLFNELYKPTLHLTRSVFASDESWSRTLELLEQRLQHL
jgi:hypothetical protein